MSAIPFLQAHWTDLIIVSYAVRDDWVTAYLPDGVELDRLYGQAYVSLVAFDFRRAQMLGVTTPFPPGLCSFPEVNLRFYANQGERSGVIFIKELVPNPLVALMANIAYNENYATARMTSRVTQVGDVRRVRHDFTVAGRRHAVAVTGRGLPSVPSGSTSTLFKERAWGFGATRCGKTISYAVHHPTWRTFDTEDLYLDVDFGALYGPTWDGLTSREPDSVVLAEGSAVEVYPWSVI